MFVYIPFDTSLNQNESDGRRRDARNRTAVRAQAMRHFRQQQRRQLLHSSSHSAPAKETGARCRPLRKKDSSISDAATSKKELHGCESLALVGHESTKSSGSADSGSPSPTCKCLGSKYPHIEKAGSFWQREEETCAAQGGADTRQDGWMARLFPNAWISCRSTISAYRLALAGNFAIDLFACKGQRTLTIERLLQLMSAGETKAMQLASDAVTLLHTGSVSGDPRLLREAKKRHLCALNRLQLDLQSSEVKFDGILATVQALLGCEAYTALQSGPYTWCCHAAGFDKIVSLCRHEGFTSPLRTFMLLQARHVNLMQSLIFRKSLSFRSETWEALTFNMLPEKSNALLNLACRLPALLELVTKVCSRANPSQAELLDARHRLILLEHHITEWQRHNYPTSTGFDNSWPANLGSFWNAIHLAFCWCCLLICRHSLCMIQDLEFDTWRDEDLYSRTNECAFKLISVVPELRATTEGRLCESMCVVAPIYFASEWYRYACDQQRLEECLAMESELRKDLCYIRWEALLPWSFLALYCQ